MRPPLTLNRAQQPKPRPRGWNDKERSRWCCDRCYERWLLSREREAANQGGYHRRP